MNQCKQVCSELFLTSVSGVGKVSDSSMGDQLMHPQINLNKNK